MSEVTAPAKSAAPASAWTRSNPFPGKLVVNRRLSGPESEKDTRHFEIDLTGWGLSYQVGDSMAVYPTNDPTLVDEIIRPIGAKGDEIVTAAKTRKPLREALLRDYSITQPTPKFLRAITERSRGTPAQAIAGAGTETGSRKLCLGYGSDRFSARASIGQISARKSLLCCSRNCSLGFIPWPRVCVPFPIKCISLSMW